MQIVGHEANPGLQATHVRQFQEPLLSSQGVVRPLHVRAPELRSGIVGDFGELGSRGEVGHVDRIRPPFEPARRL